MVTNSFSYSDDDPSDTHTITITDGADGALPNWIVLVGLFIQHSPPDNTVLGDHIIKVTVSEATNDGGAVLSYSTTYTLTVIEKPNTSPTWVAT